MKGLVTLLCAATALVVALGACNPQTTDAPVIAPVETERLTPSPTPILTPSPTPTPASTPEPSPIHYEIDQFFPKDNFFFQYTIRPSDDSEGSYVEYRASDGGDDCIQRRVKGGNPRVEVYRFDGEAIRRVQTLKNVGYTYNLIPKSPKEGEVLLKAPIELDATWKVEGGESRITSLDHNVKLPLGRMRTVEVLTTYDDGTKLRRLFYPSVGLVAEYAYSASGDLVRSIEANQYERDRAFSQTIHFFFVDETDRSIYYITKSVKVATNTDMTKVFLERLASKPGKNLIPLSSSVRINSIKLHDGAVTIDFSSALVRQMELSRFNWRPFLQALSNTFGEYYQVDRVYFTLDGEGFATKETFLLMDGEYFGVETDEARPFKP